MKKITGAVLAAVFLAVLTGCATMQNSFVDKNTTTFFPDGAVQWASEIDYYADIYARQNSKESKGDQYDQFFAEYKKMCQEKILEAAMSNKTELEQLGKKVFKNPDAGVNPTYKRLEQQLRALPPGTRLVVGGMHPGEHQVILVTFLTDDGSFDHYIVED